MALFLPSQGIFFFFSCSFQIEEKIRKSDDELVAMTMHKSKCL